MLKRLEVALRKAKKTKSRDNILSAVSLADKAAKKRTIHKNKAARIKSSLSKLLPRSTGAIKAKTKTPSKKRQKSSK
jgi:ribosomal protein S20